jgi:tRNA(Ile)-lysidine synthase
MPATNDTALQKDSSSFLDQVAIEVDRLGFRDAGVLVGVSGGADSVALLRGLHALAEPAGLRIVAAHLNHGMRPGAADDDAAWTAELCGRLAIPIVLEKVDVPAYASERRLNLEEAARVARYQFFDRAARAKNCTYVAVAHTSDDQVETVLHHLFRGTGLAGLRGMQSIRPLAEGLTLVRPLLPIRRTQIEEWLGRIGQDFRTDTTNADTSRTRSRIRHSVLPALEREFGPKTRDTLLRVADQADELQSAIQELAAGLLDRCRVDEAPDLVRLDAEMLSGQPRHLVREAFVELWRRKNWPRQAIGFDDWDRLARLVKEGGTATLPGNIEATRRGKLIAIRRRTSHG